jgi:hypothetical protein
MSLVRLVWICLPVALMLLAVTAAQASYMDAVLANNPVGYWRLGENAGTTARNSATTGSALDATAGSTMLLGNLSPGALPNDINNASTCTRGTGQGGHDGYAQVPYNSAFDFGIADGFSIEAWITPNTTYQGMQAIAGHCEMSAVGTGYYLGAYTGFASGKLAPIVQMIDANGNDLECGADVDLKDGNWHHVAMTHAAEATDGTGIKIYVDGISYPVTTYAGGALVSDIKLNAPLAIGGRCVSGPAEPFQGGLDEVAVYASELSATDIAAHWAHRNDIITPEPSSLVLIVMGVVGLLAYAWRKRN